MSQATGNEHERRDVDVLSVVLIGALVLVLVGLCLLVAGGALHVFQREAKVTPQSPARKFPAPDLIVHPGEEWARVRTSEDKTLRSYEWVDRPAGVARIPVVRAMQLLLKRGLPEVGAGQTREQLLQSRVPNLTPPPGPEATP